MKKNKINILKELAEIEYIEQNTKPIDIQPEEIKSENTQDWISILSEQKK